MPVPSKEEKEAALAKKAEEKAAADAKKAEEKEAKLAAAAAEKEKKAAEAAAKKAELEAKKKADAEAKEAAKAEADAKKKALAADKDAAKAAADAKKAEEKAEADAKKKAAAAEKDAAKAEADAKKTAEKEAKAAEAAAQKAELEARKKAAADEKEAAKVAAAAAKEKAAADAIAEKEAAKAAEEAKLQAMYNTPLALKGSNGKYLQAKANGEVDPNCPIPAKDATFTITPVAGTKDKVTITTHLGTVLGTQRDRDVQQHPEIVDSWQQWTFKKHADDRVTFSHPDNYNCAISACRSDCASMQTGCRDAEKWTVDFAVTNEKAPEKPHRAQEIIGKPLALKGNGGQYLQAMDNGEVDPASPIPGKFATFVLVPAPGAPFDKVLIKTTHGTILDGKRNKEVEQVKYIEGGHDASETEWDVTKHGDGVYSFAMKANYNSSISDCRTNCASLQTGCRDAEKWTVDFAVTDALPGAKPHKVQELLCKKLALKGNNGKYLQALESGEVDPNCPIPGKIATFILTAAPSAPLEKVVVETTHGTVLGTKYNGDVEQHPGQTDNGFQEWVITQHGDGKISLSHPGNYNASISACRSDCASMQTGCRDAEKWTVDFGVTDAVVAAPDHKFAEIMTLPVAFRGSNAKYLQAHQDGEVDPNAEFVVDGAKFIIKAAETKNKVLIHTAFATLLYSKLNGNVEQISETGSLNKDETEWDVTKHGDGVYSFAMKANYNSSISDCRTDCASMQTGCRDAEKWVVMSDFSGLPPPPAPKAPLIIDGVDAKDHKFADILGKPVALKGSKGKYLRALPNEDKEVFSTGLTPQSYETFTILPGKKKDTVVIKTSHGTLLGTKRDGNVQQHDALNGDWQQWVVTKHQNDQWSFKHPDNYNSSISDCRTDCASMQTGCRDTELWTLDYSVQEGTNAEKHPFHDIVGKPIAIKGPNGKYLRVLPDFCKMHDDREVADTVVDKAASAPMAWETFTLEGVEKPKGHAYIKTSHNNYLAANSNGDMKVVGKAKADTWSFGRHENNTFSLDYNCSGRRYNLSYCQGGNKVTCTPGLRDAEKWYIVDAVEGLAPEDQIVVDELEIQRLEREAAEEAEGKERAYQEEARAKSNEATRLAAEGAAAALAKQRAEQLAKRDADAEETKKEAALAAAKAKEIPDHPAASLIGKPLALKGHKGKYLRALPGGVNGEVDANGEEPMLNETFILFAGKKSNTVSIKTSHGTFLSSPRNKDCVQAANVSGSDEDWKITNHGTTWSFCIEGNYNCSVSDCRSDCASMQTGCRDAEKWTVNFDVAAGVWVEKHPFHEIIGRPLALKGSKKGKFLRCLPGGPVGNEIDVQGDTPHSWQTFTLEPHGKREVCIRSSHGFLIGASSGGNVCHVKNTDSKRGWEVKKQGDKYSFTFPCQSRYWLSDVRTNGDVSMQTHEDNNFWLPVFETIDAPATADQKILDDLEQARLIKEIEADGKGGGQKKASQPIPGAKVDSEAAKAKAVKAVDMKNDFPKQQCGSPEKYVSFLFDDMKFPFNVLTKFARKGILPKVEMYFDECTPAQRSQALMAAAVKKKKDVVQFLLSKGTDPNYEGSRDKYSALHLLLTEEHIDLGMMKVLLEGGANINITRKHGISVLQEALSRVNNKQAGNDIIKWIISKGADVNHVRTDGESCLHTAVSAGHVQWFETFVGPDKKFLNAPDSARNMSTTPLFLAKGNVAALRELIRLGVDQELVVVGTGGDTNALDTRCMNGDTAAVKAMMEELGFKKDFVPGRAHGTMLHSVASNRNNVGSHTAEYLIKTHGFKVDAEDDNGNTPLLVAASSGNWNVCRTLMDNKANPKHKNKKGSTAFDWAGDPGTISRRSFIELAMEHATGDFSAEKANLAPIRCGKWCASNGVPARLCSNCGFGSKKDNCCVCEKWMGSNKNPASLCNDCGWASRKDDCCKCGKWCSGNDVVYAMLCSDCGWSSKKDDCCKLK